MSLRRVRCHKMLSSFEVGALDPQTSDMSAMVLNGPAGLASDADLARFSSNLSRLREAHKLSRAALGHQIGASGKMIEHWEAGTGNPAVRYIVRLAHFFGLNTDDLLGVGPRPDEERSRLGMLLKYHEHLEAIEQRVQELEKAREHPQH